MTEIPTNVNVTRVDNHDEIYRTAAEKYKAVIDLIKECHARKQPTLVGTVSIEKSEHLSTLLKKEKIPHQVLNARYHEQEAQIIAQAGRPGAVTIATNMAGRGTDIMLGGNPNSPEFTENDSHSAARAIVVEAGGLYVLGTERHESRRIDNQLRGRSGRQGDPGASKFFLSLEDDLMRIFGAERMDGMLRTMGLKQGEAIFHPWMNKAIEKAQQKVEARNYEIRKNLLKFDDVMNDQRKAIFEQRLELIESEDVSETVAGMREEINSELTATYVPKKSYPEQWDMESFAREVYRIYGLHLPLPEWAKEEGVDDAIIAERLTAATNKLMAHKEAKYGPILRMAEKRVLLETLDGLWKDHLLSLDHLRHGIHLRGYGQRDPLNEYKQEAFSLFEALLAQLRELVTSRMAHLEIRVENPEALARMPAGPKRMHETRNDPAATGGPTAAPPNTPSVTIRTHVKAEDRDPNDPATWGKVGRNDPCPCGSGKKFKLCHGKLG